LLGVGYLLKELSPMAADAPAREPTDRLGVRDRARGAPDRGDAGVDGAPALVARGQRRTGRRGHRLLQRRVGRGVAGPTRGRGTGASPLICQVRSTSLKSAPVGSATWA